jgi:hypothetical protein
VIIQPYVSPIPSNKADKQMLALAETVQLSEWKEYAESTGCLSVRELLRRAATIETLLQERSWREGLLDANGGVVDDGSSGESPENQSAIRVMREIFYGAARLYLATVINGPYPRGESLLILLFLMGSS